MSAYTTKTITRDEAEKLLRAIYCKKLSFGMGSNKDVGDELNEYAYSGEHSDELGTLYNFEVIDNPS